MAESITPQQDRHDFGHISATVPIPNLLEIQMKSYQTFLQMELLPNEREDIGIQSVFTSIFPIEDFRSTASLEFVHYTLGDWECKCGSLVGIEHLRSKCVDCGQTIVTNPQHLGHIICPACGARNENKFSRCVSCGDPVELKIKYTIDECIDRGMTYSVPLKVTVRLVLYDVDEESGSRTIRDMKQQEVFFGEVPLMTPRGTFIINGTERVIVSQLHRSPGVFFEVDSERKYYLGKVIPYRGSWVEFEYDHKNILYIRIDRKRKFLATIFLRALGYESNEEILNLFYRPVTITLKGGKISRMLDETLIGSKLRQTVTHPDDPTDVLYKSGERFNFGHLEDLKSIGMKQLLLTADDLQGAILLNDVVNMETGEILGEANEDITATMINRMFEAGVKQLQICYPEFDDAGPTISATLHKDPIQTSQEALIEFYKKLRPGDPPTLEVASSMFQGMFFDAKRYDLSKVGRLKSNLKLDRDIPLTQRTLTQQDFIDVLNYQLKLPVG
ncbi:MAG TPA: DNA-directed RNA polymerase subunit beta, partial [Acidobacteriota bacterium]|nr:DNA-directed RNA polymerase subunit beta [Acidobacteriota bacterium]